MFELYDRLFKVQPSTLPKDGDVLLARPFLNDRNFSGSVVLMVDCEDSDADDVLGVVVNRPLDITVNDAISGLNLPSDPKLFLGGPVGRERLVIAHTLGPDIIPGSIELQDGLFLGGDYEAALEYIRAGGEPEGYMKFFVGYAGWNKKQLMRELADGTWAIANLSSEQIISPDTRGLWHNAVATLDDRYGFWKKIPRQAGLN